MFNQKVSWWENVKLRTKRLTASGIDLTPSMWSSKMFFFQCLFWFDWVHLEVWNLFFRKINHFVFWRSDSVVYEIHPLSASPLIFVKSWFIAHECPTASAIVSKALRQWLAITWCKLGVTLRKNMKMIWSQPVFVLLRWSFDFFFDLGALISRFSLWQ